MQKQLVILFFIFLMALCGCAKKIDGTATPIQRDPVPADLKNFPQNLDVYAKNAGFDHGLMDSSQQERMAEKFLSIYFGPWQMRKTSIKKHEVACFFNKARGYKYADMKWTQYEWDEMRANANLSSFPSMAIPAITLRQTDLRELPTHEYRFSEPTPDPKLNPFDYFQYSLLPPGMPVLLVHQSLDRNWFYVECPIAGGWVNAKDLAEVDSSFISLWKEGKFAALVKDNVNLPGTGYNRKDSTAGIGTLLPYKSGNNSQGMSILVPVKGPEGKAMPAEVTIAYNTAVIWPLQITPGNIARVGNVMMGQNYGWGGMFGDRDCSALIRDLFTPFGIWLPRNSGAQARRGIVISLTGLNPQEKANIILDRGIPFLSLVGMKGHICLYIGNYKGKPAIFHNVWGLRIIENGNDDARLVIGKAVVTSITPGMELDNLYTPVTFVDRLRSLTILGTR